MLDEPARDRILRVTCPTGCRVCGAACPAGAIRFERDQVLIDGTACTRCLVCVSVCPEEIIGKDVFA